LNDERWYFVRNLVLILRNLDNEDVRQALHRLLEGSHQKVRVEALRSLLHFGDPKAERMILQDLESKRLRVRMNALQLAGHSRNIDIFNKVARVLEGSFVLHYHFDLRKAAVNAMLEMGLPQSIVELRRHLRTWNPLHPLQHRRLKREIVRALARFPTSETTGLLEEAESDVNLGALARHSIDTIRKTDVS
jgi:HEAT repeat protein